MYLNLGCGKDIKAGFINIDKIFFKGVDVVCDLEDGLPFRANVFDKIFSRYVLEHISDLVFIMREIHRVLKPNGIAHLEVPHCSCVHGYTDPTHKTFFAYRTMDFFAEDSETGYFLNIKFKFKIITKKLHFSGDPRLNFLNRIINPIINRFSEIYERFFLWILPVNKIIFVMKAIKDEKKY